MSELTTNISLLALLRQKRWEFTYMNITRTGKEKIHEMSAICATNSVKSLESAWLYVS